MTEDELVDFILLEQKEKVEIRYIRTHVLKLGFTADQFEKAMESAQLKKQQDAEKDPALRLLLGPTLVITAGFCFYTEWAGRSIGIASFLGLVTLFLGLRLLYSLVKQTRRRA